MLKLVDNDIYRGGTKIGYTSGDDIYNMEGRKVGYYSASAEDIFDANGRKIAHFEGNYLKTHDGRSVRIDEVRKRVNGGAASDIERAAIYLLIGD